MRALVAVVGLVGCHPQPHAIANRGGGDVEITLYRDHAAVVQHFDVRIDTAATVHLRVAAGIDPAAVYVDGKSEVAIRGAHADKLGGKTAPMPVDVTVELVAPRPGTYPVALAYDTPRVTWDVAYTAEVPPAHDRVRLRGALAIRNATGLALAGAELWVVDADHGPVSLRIAERVRRELVARNGNTAPLAVPRDLGRIELAEGDTRVELLGDGLARPARDVLVYDPIGAVLDHPGVTPVRDPNLGIEPPASPRVAEAIEIVRDKHAIAGLPAGPVQVLEHRPDGALALLGQATLFGVATRYRVTEHPELQYADVDSIAIGVAEGVTGKRERRELTIDEDRKRLVEEFVVTIDNARDHPVEVVLREHFYRGLNWALAYQSIPLEHAAKEGAQEVALRVVVPAQARSNGKRGRLRVLYTAVYTWG